MDILSRIADVTRAGFRGVQRRGFGSSGKSLEDLSDAELEEEVLRRRRLRAGNRGRAGNLTDSPEGKRLAQCYANLELRPGAPMHEIKASYRRLMRKYHPDKHADDPDRHKTATELAAELTRAYETLVKEQETSDQDS